MNYTFDSVHLYRGWYHFVKRLIHQSMGIFIPLINLGNCLNGFGQSLFFFFKHLISFSNDYKRCISLILTEPNYATEKKSNSIPFVRSVSE